MTSQRLCVLFVACLACLLPSRASFGGEAERARLGLVVPSWRREHACGANCLYAYLRLLGQDVDHDTLLDAVVLSERGATLAELRRVTGMHGVPSSTVHATPEVLPKLDTPFIAHMLPIHGSSTDHFVVVVGQDNENVTIIDGDDGQVRKVARDKFEAGWSGYLLIPEKGQYGWYWVVGCLILIGVVIGLARSRQGTSTGEAT